MVFSSLLFLFRFLPAVLLAYYMVPRSLRNPVLLFFSLLFYAWGEPIAIVLLLASIVVSYTAGILIDGLRQREKEKAARAVLLLSAAGSLSLLFFFKYAGLAAETVNRITGADITPLQTVLPIGISFYTFQIISYLTDVYRGEAPAQKNLISYGTYVSMFPQLIAGPIVQYKTIDTQLCARRETLEQFAEGIRRFLTGLGKKVLIANPAGELWNAVQASQYTELPVLTAWMGIAAYTFQIYFDFSAYSDMAIGLGHMFGFRFRENFDYPYLAKSITEFWRRWHISLGTWFREYVYIPLGGNRAGKWKHIRNILIVWLFTGLWHGASWNFAVWGMYYGLLLLAEKYIFGKYLKRLPGMIQHGYCIFFVMLGWSLFVFEDMGQELEFFKALFGAYEQGLFNRETIYLFYNNIFLLILCILGSTRLPQQAAGVLWKRLEGKAVLQSVLQNIFYAAVAILSIAWLTDATFNPFLYFRF